MTTKENGTADLVCSSYEIAWQEYSTLPGLTPDEHMFGPDKLRSYIQVMADLESATRSRSQVCLGNDATIRAIVRSKAGVTRW